jgi:hypothetical protein
MNYSAAETCDDEDCQSKEWGPEVSHPWSAAYGSYLECDLADLLIGRRLAKSHPINGIRRIWLCDIYHHSCQLRMGCSPWIYQDSADFCFCI